MSSVSAARLGTRLDNGQPLDVADRWLQRHALVFGGSGFGKSFLSYVLIREQLRRDCSLVAIDPKRATIKRLRAACQEVGIKPPFVVTIDAADEDPDGAPGLNPFRVPGASPDEAVASVLDIFDKSGALTGSRIESFLANAVAIAAWHGVPLGGVPRILKDQAFRETLLARDPPRPRGALYDEAVHYFQNDFILYGPTERESSVLAITTKFTRLFSCGMLLRLFHSARNTVDFDALFCRPGAVLVSIEPKAGGLSEAAGSLVAGIVVDLLFAAARRRKGEVPVVLAVDEVRKLSGMLEEGLRDVVNMAREANIRLLVAGQHPGQLPAGVRDDLLVSSTVRAYFNPGKSAEITVEAAKALSMKPLPVAQALIEATPAPPMRPFRGRIAAYQQGRWQDSLVEIQPELGIRPSRNRLEVYPGDADWALYTFMKAACPSFRPPLYIEGTDMRVRDALEAVPQGCRAFLRWHAGCGWLEVDPPPPAPPSLPPKPVSAVEYWAPRLSRLDAGQAILDVGNDPPVEVRVTHVSPRRDASHDYVAAARRANRAVPYRYPTRKPIELAPDSFAEPGRGAGNGASSGGGKRSRRPHRGGESSVPPATAPVPTTAPPEEQSGKEAPPRVAGKFVV